MGEAKRKATLRKKEGISVDIFGGRVHIDIDLEADTDSLPEI